MAKHMLEIECNGGHQDDNQRKAEFDLYGHRYILPNEFTTCLPKTVLRFLQG